MGEVGLEEFTVALSRWRLGICVIHGGHRNISYKYLRWPPELIVKTVTGLAVRGAGVLVVSRCMSHVTCHW